MLYAVVGQVLRSEASAEVSPIFKVEVKERDKTCNWQRRSRYNPNIYMVLLKTWQFLMMRLCLSSYGRHRERQIGPELQMAGFSAFQIGTVVAFPILPFIHCLRISSEESKPTQRIHHEPPSHRQFLNLRHPFDYRTSRNSLRIR